MEDINYSLIIDDALHYAVKKVLKITEKNGLVGNHHFFISFITNFPGVNLSDRIKSRYPEEITIVLQHQFEELKVSDDQFSVILSFNNVKEKIVVPFAALTAFADPSAKFGLQFRQAEEYYVEHMNKADVEHKDHQKNTLTEEITSSPETHSVSVPTTNVIDLKAFKKGKNKSDIELF